MKWRDIGRALRVSSDVLDEIYADHYLRDDSQRMERVPVEWLHSGKATDHQLMRALEDKSVRCHDIAMEICSSQRLREKSRQVTHPLSEFREETKKDAQGVVGDV